MRVSTEWAQLPLFVAGVLIVTFLIVSRLTDVGLGAIMITALTISNTAWSFAPGQGSFGQYTPRAVPSLPVAKTCLVLACLALGIVAVVSAIIASNTIDRAFSVSTPVLGAGYCLARYKEFARTVSLENASPHQRFGDENP